jgi:redox-sensitive bicupin YhaK (pirin superfamily)
MSIRPIARMSRSVPTREGAGVRLHRAFPFGDPAEFDPFLLLDDFRSDNPADYRAGFPWHPHRGIETISYVLAGAVEHQDSLGNRGVLAPGDIQWMTAGSGILHQEMPQGDPHGRMHGFQLWANLPSSLKMTRPRYQDVPSRDVPDVIEDDGTTVRVLCGRFGGKTGPVEGIAADPRCLDVTVPAGRRARLAVEVEQFAFAYVFAGSGVFRDASAPRGVPTESVGPTAPASVGSDDAPNRTLILFDRGDEVVVQAGDQGVRFLLVSGRPIREPIAWYGPIVMNTDEELLQAQRELRDGTFIRPPS